MRLLLPFAALWSSISWLGELRLWYLTGQQITAPLKALWKWPISHLCVCVCWGGAAAEKRIPLWFSTFIETGAYSLLLDFCAIFESDENEILNSKGYFCWGTGDTYLWVCFPVFFFFPPTGRNINKNPTFSALVIPVIKTCWQLKVKFIVTLGPRVCCHIKNWLRMQSWPSNRHKRRGEIKGLPSEDLTTTLVPLSLGMCVYGNVCCAS